jgi:hypothetical protein
VNEWALITFIHIHFCSWKVNNKNLMAYGSLVWFSSLRLSGLVQFIEVVWVGSVHWGSLGWFRLFGSFVGATCTQLLSRKIVSFYRQVALHSSPLILHITSV